MFHRKGWFRGKARNATDLHAPQQQLLPFLFRFQFFACKAPLTCQKRDEAFSTKRITQSAETKLGKNHKQEEEIGLHMRSNM
jgi:hypothetical protein